MKKGLRRLIIFFIFFIPLTVCLSYFGWLALQLDNYKHVVAQAIEKQTGRQLTIHGHLGLVFSWHPTVSATDVTFNNASWSKTPTAAKINKLTIQFDLKALFHQQLKIEHMSIDTAQFLFERNTKNVSNWHFDTPSATDAAFVTFSRPFDFDLDLTKVTITIRHADKTTEDIYVAKANFILNGPANTIKLTANGIANHSPFKTTTTIIYPEDRVKGRYQIKMFLDAMDNHLELQGTFTRGRRTRQDNFQLYVTGKNFADIIGLFGTPYLKTGNFTLKTNLRINGEQFQFTNIVANMLGGQITGTFGADISGLLPKYNFDLIGKGLEAGSTMQALELSDHFKNGRMYIHYQVNTIGFTEQSLLGNQTGTITLGLNHTYYHSRGLRIYTQKLFQLLSGGSSQRGVDFDCLVMRLNCTTGNCVIKGFAFNTAGANVVGKGSINLANNTLNVLIIPVSKIVNLNPLAIPMNVTGPIQNPNVSPAPVVLTKQLLGDLFNVITGKTVVNLISAGLSPTLSSDQGIKSCLNTLSDFKKESKSLPQKALRFISQLNPFACKNIYGPLGRQCNTTCKPQPTTSEKLPTTSTTTTPAATTNHWQETCTGKNPVPACNMKRM